MLSTKKHNSGLSERNISWIPMSDTRKNELALKFKIMMRKLTNLQYMSKTDELYEARKLTILQETCTLPEDVFYELCYFAIENTWQPVTVILMLLQYQKNYKLNERFLKKLIELAELRGYISLIDYINSIDNNLIKTFPLSRQMLSSSNKEYIENNVPDIAVFDNITPRLKAEMAKLLFAAKDEKYKSPLRVVVLEDEQFDNFFAKLSELIINTNISLRLQFTHGNSITKHWISGDIKIHEGKIQICLCDSLGAGEIISESKLTCNEYIEIIKKYIPTAEIFCGVEKIQHDKDSCRLFAVDNVLHLHTTNEYLPSKYSDLYIYLRKNKIDKRVYANSIEITLTKLPLRLLRAIQSLESTYTNNLTFYEKAGIFPRLTLEKADHTELKTPINKNGELMDESVRKYLSPKNEKQYNQRIQHKVDTIRKHILDFLLNHDAKQIEFAIKKFSLDGMIEYINNEKQTQMNNLLDNNEGNGFRDSKSNIR